MKMEVGKEKGLRRREKLENCNKRKDKIGDGE